MRPANLVTDRSVTGTAIQYSTSDFLSAEPLNPTDPDKSSWVPAFRPKVDSDGNIRVAIDAEQMVAFCIIGLNPGFNLPGQFR